MKNLFTVILVLSVYYVSAQKTFEGPQLEQQKLKQELFQQEHNYGKESFSNHEMIGSLEDIGDAPGFDWLKQMGGTAVDKITCLTTDGSGNIYAGGYYSGNITIEDQDFTSQGLHCGFVMKLSNTGDFIWFRDLKAEENSRSKILDMAIDASDNIYLTGYYEGKTYLGDEFLDDLAAVNAFMGKLDQNANVLFAKNLNQVGWKTNIGPDLSVNEQNELFFVIRERVDVSVGNSVYIKTDYEGNILLSKSIDDDFVIQQIHTTDEGYRAFGWLDGNLVVGGTTYTSFGYGNCTVIDFDGTDEMNWATLADGYENYNNNYSATDNDGNIYYTGTLWGTTTFGNHTLTILNSPAYFLTKCNNSGNYEWAISLQEPPSCISLNENILVASGPDVYNYSKQGFLQETYTFEYPVRNLYGKTSNSFVTGYRNVHDMFIEMREGDNQNWINQTSGAFNNAQIYEMIDDNQESIYTLGYLSGQVEYYNYDGPPIQFLAKHDKNGNLIWLKELPKELIFKERYSDERQLAIDPDGDYIYLIGGFEQNIQLGNDIFEPEYVGYFPKKNNILFAKFNDEGNYVSGKQVPVWHESTSISISQTKIFISGLFNSTFNIHGTEISGQEDMFFACYEKADHQFNWIKSAGGNSVTWAVLIGSDSQDNLYVSGESISYEEVYFADSAFNLDEAAGHVVLAKLNAEGNTQWLHYYGRDLNTQPSYQNSLTWPNDIYVTDDGYIYLKGSHGNNVEFGNFTLSIPENFAYFNHFISKLNPAGEFVWVKSVSEERYFTTYNQMDVDNNGNVYFGFYNTDTLWFEDKMFPIQNSGYGIASYTSDGNFKWAKSMESSENGYMNSICVIDSTSIFATGYFNHLLQAESYYLATAQQTSFLGKLNTTNTRIIETGNNLAFDVFPNPADNVLMVRTNSRFTKDIYLHDITGRQIYSISTVNPLVKIDLGDISKGIYLLKVSSVDKQGVSKIIVR